MENLKDPKTYHIVIIFINLGLLDVVFVALANEATKNINDKSWLFVQLILPEQ